MTASHIFCPTYICANFNFVLNVNQKLGVSDHGIFKAEVLKHSCSGFVVLLAVFLRINNCKNCWTLGHEECGNSLCLKIKTISYISFLVDELLFRKQFWFESGTQPAQKVLSTNIFKQLKFLEGFSVDVSRYLEF